MVDIALGPGLVTLGGGRSVPVSAGWTDRGSIADLPGEAEGVEYDLAGMLAEALSRGLGCGRRNGRSSPASGCSGRLLPCVHRLRPELAERAAGDQVTLDVKCVLDGGVHREEYLS